jgi:hypothetical protein
LTKPAASSLLQGVGSSWPSCFLPDSDSFNHATIRNRMLKVGQQIEVEAVAEISERSVATTTVERMVVAIDGAYVAASGLTRRRYDAP